MEFPENIRSDILELRCLTWLRKQDEKLVIPPYCNFIVQKKMHLMMFSVPEGYEVQPCKVVVVMDDSLIKFPLEFDTKNMITNGRPVKLVIIAMPTEEMVGNERKC